MGTEAIVVIGGGLVGASLAFGMARLGAAVRVLDQGDVAFRASRGNFGLVWVQSKGENLPEYARWSRDAAALWPAFHRELFRLTEVDCGLRQQGGFWLGFSEAEVEAHAELLSQIDRRAGGIPFEMMEPAQLKRYLPGLGPAVVGGSYCPLDGHANPLMLLRALHAALRRMGADVVSGVDVMEVEHHPASGNFTSIAADGRRWTSDKVVLAAGLGNARLAPQLGIIAPIETTRGQILITERLQPLLEYPMNGLRQTLEGTVQIGATNEDVGLDDHTTTEKIKWLARRAVAKIPALRRARVVRAWAALRVLTPDGYPIYDASETCPGAYLASTHSGVTLAPSHAMEIAPWILGVAPAPKSLSAFSGGRFADPQKTYVREH